MAATVTPDLDQYIRTPVDSIPGHAGGCEGCAFRNKTDIKCSAIPCQHGVGRPAAIYIAKPDAKGV